MMARPTTARRVAMLNNKGGVGKSGTTARLAEGLAKAGKRVLVVDMDPQGNSSGMLGWRYDPKLKQPTISQAIKANTDPNEALGCARAVFQPIGWECTGRDGLSHALEPLAPVLRPLGIGVWQQNEHTGEDISPLQELGVSCFHPLVDSRTYFWYHHTQADTFDKVEPQSLRENSASMAALALFLCERPRVSRDLR